MGIPFSDPYFLYGDNKSVLYNTTLPEITLKKKSNSIADQLVEKELRLESVLLDMRQRI